jgi:hypothetical protein
VYRKEDGRAAVASPLKPARLASSDGQIRRRMSQLSSRTRVDRRQANGIRLRIASGGRRVYRLRTLDQCSCSAAPLLIPSRLPSWWSESEGGLDPAFASGATKQRFARELCHQTTQCHSNSRSQFAIERLRKLRARATCTSTYTLEPMRARRCMQ